MMKFLRNILYPVPGAVFFCFLISGLLLQLNPSTDFKTYIITALKLLPFYGTGLLGTVFLFALIYSFVAERSETSGYFPVFLSFSFLLMFFLTTLIYVYNYLHFYLYLEKRSLSLVFIQICILVFSAFTSSIIFLRSIWGEKKLGNKRYLILSAISIVACGTPLVLSLLFPFEAIPRISVTGKPVIPERKIIVLGFDSATMDIILPMISEGRLPNFDSILKKGSWARLKSIRPTLEPPVWATASTGTMPYRHGIKDYKLFAACEECCEYTIVPKGMLFRKISLTGFFKARDFTLKNLKVKNYWNILGMMGIDSGTVNWPGTSPAETVKGFFVTDMALEDEYKEGQGFYPPAISVPADLNSYANPFSEVIKQSEAIDPARGKWISDASSNDITYNKVAIDLFKKFQPSVMTLNLKGLENISHHFYSFYEPDKFGNVTGPKKDLYENLLSNYYVFMDRILGQWIELAAENYTIVVFSPYGIEAMDIWGRLTKHILLESPVSGSHRNSPDGILIVSGKGIKKDFLLESAAILDLVPTILYMLDLPASDDMEGNILTDIFTDDYRQSHPVSLIPSYEDLTVISEDLTVISD